MKKNILAENLLRFGAKNLSEDTKKKLEEQTDKYLGKYMNRFAMYINDEGHKYIRDKNTNWHVIDIEDGEGNERPENDIRRDIIAARTRESAAEFKTRMRGY
jgi:hypothetical protein